MIEQRLILLIFLLLLNDLPVFLTVIIVSWVEIFIVISIMRSFLRGLLSFNYVLFDVVGIFVRKFVASIGLIILLKSFDNAFLLFLFFADEDGVVLILFIFLLIVAHCDDVDCISKSLADCLLYFL